MAVKIALRNGTAKKTSASNGKKTAKSRPPATPKTKAKKTSALDAAAKVLAESSQPMSCQEMIEAMAAKGYWSSPAGKTPSATLYSAIQRECKTKAKAARFKKTGPGKFVLIKR